MHRIRLVCAMVLAIGASTMTALPAHADGKDVWCDPTSGFCKIVVTKKGRPADRDKGAAGQGSRAGKGAGTSVAAAKPNPCKYVLSDPQPPKSAAIWDGHTGGAIYLYVCPRASQDPTDFLATVVEVWQGAPPPAEAIITPAELAQQALASLRLPRPVLHRSPGESNSDAGVPYTWVNLWTWYWTSPATWRQLSRTASLATVSATVTVAPTKLTFDPGDGSPPVSCAGPGRAWTKADGNAAPSHGGCGYRYRSVSDGVRPTVSITWDVSWTGSGGTGGTLPVMTTSTTSPPFKVEQIQVVNR
jgi:hypothetical protein